MKEPSVDLVHHRSLLLVRIFEIDIAILVPVRKF